jgi:hypothetical protein
MTLPNFTKLSQELRDQIWAEAAASQGQQVRGNFFKCNTLLLLPLSHLLTVTQLVEYE